MITVWLIRMLIITEHCVPGLGRIWCVSLSLHDSLPGCFYHRFAAAWRGQWATASHTDGDAQRLVPEPVLTDDTLRKDISMYRFLFSTVIWVPLKGVTWVPPSLKEFVFQI